MKTEESVSGRSLVSMTKDLSFEDLHSATITKFTCASDT